MQLVEVVGCVDKTVPPIEPEPTYVVLDGSDILDALGGGVGVVHPQVAQSPVLGGQTEVETHRLGVADMQEAIGLWRKPGMHAALVLPGLLILGHDLPDKVESARRRSAGASVCCRVFRMSGH